MNMGPQAQASACRCPVKNPRFDDDIGLFMHVFVLHLILAVPASTVMFFILKSLRAVLDQVLLYAYPESVRSEVGFQSRKKADKGARLWSNELITAYCSINIAWAFWYPNSNYWKPFLVVLGMMLLANFLPYLAAFVTILFRRATGKYRSTPAILTKDRPHVLRSKNTQHAEKEAAPLPPPDIWCPYMLPTQLESDVEAARTSEIKNKISRNTVPQSYSTSNAGSTALQSYHLQLELLNEQNKRRLAMAKQEQDRERVQQ